MRKVFAVVIVVLALWSVTGVRSHLRAQGSTPAAARAQRAAAQQNPAVQAEPAAQPTPKPDARPTPLPAPGQARANGQRPAVPAATKAQPTGSGTKRIVDFEADQMHPVKLANDSTALALSGKVVFFHNGAVIQCDSAVRYSDKHMECFDNVVINKQKTYVYGDRADYNGDINTARVYAPIIKIVDDDVVMHTYNFSFNTLTNTGRFWGRGTVRQKKNLLESERGYYYSDERRAVCVDRAELRNDEYRMKSDSVSYDMNTEQAEFFVLSYIWNQGGEILSAERGQYIKADSAYRFTRSAYVINKEQELWSDTLHYNSRTEDAELWSNIQIRDEEHAVISFGDYGLYWGKREEAMLTRDPQALNFDRQQKEDTLYVRSDSMFLYTISREAAEQIGRIAEETIGEELITAPVRAKAGAADSLAMADSLASSGLETGTDSLAGPRTELEKELDQGADSLSPRELRALEKERERAADKAERAARIAARAKVQKEKDAIRAAEQKARDEARAEKNKRKRNARDHDHDHEGHEHADSVELRAAAVAAIVRADSVLAASKARTDSLLTHGKTEKQDSMVRVVRAYRNVRMFRSDFQAVCDSLVAFSIDSTAHMYIDPVMWNGLNQIKSDVIDLYSRDQQLLKAVYTGKPVMSSEVDSTRYNQIRGKVIEAHFRDNEIYRTDVDGNAETLYYMTEKDSLGYEDVVGFMVAESANISFDIEDKQVIRITYRGNPVTSSYPMDKIPADQPQRFPDFVWEIGRKPAMEDVFTRTVRPSQRERYEALPQPAFPITDQITRHRDQMIKDGTWRDRNDVLGEHALLFIRSLGY